MKMLIKKLNNKNLKIVLYFFFLFCSITIFSQDKNTNKIAISIDDLPTLSHGLLNKQQQQEYFFRILNVLDKYKIKALGFVVGKSVNNWNKHLVKEFISRGHTIGNHTFKHFDLNRVSSSQFITDIRICDSILNVFNTAKHYFRYPMLHRGDETRKKSEVEKYLKNKDFQIVPVSIDTDETEFNIQFVKSYIKGDTIEAKRIGEKYLIHMTKKSLYFENQVKEKHKKPIKHILLLHMNFINSFYLDKLLNWYENYNWQFISIEEALSDPFYSLKDKYVGEKGLSYIERVYNE